jgi:phosphate transport system protein
MHPAKETHLQQMLTALRTRLLIMGAAVGIAIDEACAALEEGNAGRAAAVVDGDIAIDQMENEVDELSLSLLVRNQPVAQDLRFVVAALRMVLDLERIGDEAASIAEQVVLMEDGLPEEIMREVRSLMNMAVNMYSQAMDAFRSGNGEAALGLCRVEDEVAQQDLTALHRIMDVCFIKGQGKGPGSVYGGMNGILICKSFNRICRRCSNIGEHIYFIVKGVDIKHRSHKH